MNEEFFSDFDRDEQRKAMPQDWPVSPGAPTVEQTLSAPLAAQLHDNLSKYFRKASAQLSICADDVALDEHCRVILRKLVSAGCTSANQPYSLEQFQVTEQELRYLKQHGFVHARASTLLQPVIQSYERIKAGADVGKIALVLNVHLR